MENRHIVINSQDLDFISKVKSCGTWLNCKDEKELFVITKKEAVNFLENQGMNYQVLNKEYVSVPSDEKTNIFFFCKTKNGISFIKFFDGDTQYIVNKNDYVKFIRFCYKLRKSSYNKNRVNKPILSEEVERIIKEEVLDFFVYAKNAEECGVKLTKGIVLSGPPGNGKTSILKWIMFLAKGKKLSCETITGAAIESASHNDKLEEILHRANIVAFDDVDIALFNRQNSGGQANKLLSAMDGPKVIVKKPILRIFTTNESLKGIDEAFIRPGRIDKFLKVELPDADMRRKFIATWHPTILNKISGSDIDYIVNNTDKTSFAWMENIKSEIFHQMMANKINVPAAVEHGKTVEVMKEKKSVGFSK